MNGSLRTFFEQVTEEGKRYKYFQWDILPGHNAENSLQALRNMLEEWIISRCPVKISLQILVFVIFIYEKTWSSKFEK